jgi:hypothetical protein
MPGDDDVPGTKACARMRATQGAFDPRDGGDDEHRQVARIE